MPMSVSSLPVSLLLVLLRTHFQDNEDRALSAYKQEWHERGHSNLEVTVSGLILSILGLELVRTE